MNQPPLLTFNCNRDILLFWVEGKNSGRDAGAAEDSAIGVDPVLQNLKVAGPQRADDLIRRNSTNSI